MASRSIRAGSRRTFRISIAAVILSTLSLAARMTIPSAIFHLTIIPFYAYVTLSSSSVSVSCDKLCAACRCSRRSLKKPWILLPISCERRAKYANSATTLVPTKIRRAGEALADMATTSAGSHPNRIPSPLPVEDDHLMECRHAVWFRSCCRVAADVLRRSHCYFTACSRRYTGNKRNIGVARLHGPCGAQQRY